MPSLHTLLILFITFCNIGALSFGGGYAAVQLTKEQTVNVQHWLTMEEFAQIVAISEMTPGPLALNAASYVGAKQGGAAGAVTATAGVIFPPFCITSLLAFLYAKYKDCWVIDALLKGIKPIVAGMIIAVAVSFFKLAVWPSLPPDLSGTDLLTAAIGCTRWHSLLTALIVWAAIHAKKLGPISAICCTGIFGLLLSICFGIS